jgi:hypothetical protein
MLLLITLPSGTQIHFNTFAYDGEASQSGWVFLSALQIHFTIIL